MNLQSDLGLPHLGAEPHVRELREAREPCLHRLRERQRRVEVLASDADGDVGLSAPQQLAQRRRLPHLDGHRARRERVQERAESFDHGRARPTIPDSHIDARGVRTGLLLG